MIAHVRRAKRRRFLAVGLALVVVFALSAGALSLIALAEPEGGPGHTAVDWVEEQIRRDDTLHYRVHMVLGKIFSFCPCTQRISISQYSKAAYHRPKAIAP